MKYNQKRSSKIENLAGGLAYKESDKLAFVSLVLTSFLKDKFYSSENEQVEQIKQFVSALDSEFVAKTALYARNEFGMRSVSHLIAGEIAKKVRGAKWTRSFFNQVVKRPDDLLEILAYYFSTEKKLSNPLRDGFATAIERFSEYQLAKYRGEGKSIKMVDAVNLCHPKSNEALSKLMKGTLKSFDTWETELSKTGGDEELKKGVWSKLIKSKKIGYFALLRNLRNIIEQSPEVITEALELLVDENLIKKSLVLPFRYLTAIKEIQQLNGSGVRQTLVALSKAVDISLSNVPKYNGKTLVVLDTSGSMSGQPIEIGSLFASAMYKSNDADYIQFSDDAKYQTFNPADSTLSLVNQIIRSAESGGTNFHAIFSVLNQKYDRIFIFSDMQGWVGYDTPQRDYLRYCKEYECSPKIYSFDLSGYGSLQFPENNVYAIAGFSEKSFDIIKLFEQDKNALVNKIESIEL